MCRCRSARSPCCGSCGHSSGRVRVFHSSQASAGTLFRRAVELAGIQDLRFHDTRHEACSRTGLKVPDALHLSRITGHRDPRMLRRYFNPTVTEMAAWLD